MENTEAQTMARKIRDNEGYNNEAKVGELFVQMLRDGGDVEFMLEGAEVNDVGIDNSINDGRIKTLEIYRGVGASGKNYPVKLPGSRQHTKLTEGQKIEGVAFAGKGTDTPIRDRFFLEAKYQIPAGEWQKVSGNGTVVLEGANRLAELHWYEAKGEIYDMKIKRYLDEG